MSNQPADIFVVKYALSQGIFKKTLVERKSGFYTSPRRSDEFWCLSRKEVALSKEEALEKAEQLRAKRVKSLTKRVQKLKAMTFKIEGDGA